MDFDELLALLEIDSIEEFGYFEQFAALIECDDEIPYEIFYKILADVDSDTLIDLTGNYFDDVLQGIPDDGIDVYTLLSTIRQALTGLAKNSSTREERVAYTDELFKFRNWYFFESVVHLRLLSDNSKKDVTLSEALSLFRLEKFNNEQYRYDFSDCLDYDIDEYSISIDMEIDEEYDEIIEEDEDHYEEGLIDKDFPVIDGENYDGEEEYEY
jgi:hypothetical protein